MHNKIKLTLVSSSSQSLLYSKFYCYIAICHANQYDLTMKRLGTVIGFSVWSHHTTIHMVHTNKQQLFGHKDGVYPQYQIQLTLCHPCPAADCVQWRSAENWRWEQEMLSAVIRTARKWFCRDGEIGKFVISMFWLSVCLSFTDIAIQHPTCTAGKLQAQV